MVSRFRVLTFRTGEAGPNVPAAFFAFTLNWYSVSRVRPVMTCVGFTTAAGWVASGVPAALSTCTW